MLLGHFLSAVVDISLTKELVKSLVEFRLTIMNSRGQSSLIKEDVQINSVVVLLSVEE